MAVTELSTMADSAVLAMVDVMHGYVRPVKSCYNVPNRIYVRQILCTLSHLLS